MTPLRPARRDDREAWEYVVKHDESVRKFAAALFNSRRRNGGRSITLEDACQHARLAAFRAAQLFDEQRGLSFMTLAAYWIRARLHKLFQNHGYPGANKRETEELSIDQAQERGVGGYPPWLIRLMGNELSEPGSAVDLVIHRERVKRLQVVLSGLPKRHQIVLKARFFECRSLDEVGRCLHITREGARQIEKVALKHLHAGMTALESGVSPDALPTFRSSRRSARMASCRARTSSSFSASA